MLVACPSCAKQLNVPDNAVGKNVRCPGCQQIFPIGGGPNAAAQQVQAHAPAPRPAPAPRHEPEPQYDEDDIGYTAPTGEARRIAANGGFWLTLSAWYLIGSMLLYMLVGSIFQYMKMQILFAEIQKGMPVGPPGAPNFNMAAGGFAAGTMILTLVCVAIIMAPFIVFIFLGGSFLPKFKSRGIIITGVVMAFILGALYVISIPFGIYGLVAPTEVLPGRRVSLPSYILAWDAFTLVVSIIGAVVLIVGGMKALGALNHPAVKEVYGVR